MRISMAAGAALLLATPAHAMSDEERACPVTALGDDVGKGLADQYLDEEGDAAELERLQGLVLDATMRCMATYDLPEDRADHYYAYAVAVAMRSELVKRLDRRNIDPEWLDIALQLHDGGNAEEIAALDERQSGLVTIALGIHGYDVATLGTDGWATIAAYARMTSAMYLERAALS